MSLDAILEQLEAFGAGRISGAELRAWWLPYLVAIPPERPDGAVDAWTPETDRKTLFWSLIWHFESSERDDNSKRNLATRLVRCARELGPGATLDLMPAISMQERLSMVATKHRAGIMSRTGFVSVVRKARLGELEEWLLEASLDEVERFWALLRDQDYTGAAALGRL